MIEKEEKESRRDAILFTAAAWARTLSPNHHLRASALTCSLRTRIILNLSDLGVVFRLLHDLCPADWAPVLRFEPFFDAVWVELVETRQREQLFTLIVVSQADGALKIVCFQPQHFSSVLVRTDGVIWYLLRLLQLLGANGIIQKAFAFWLTSARQLRENVSADRILIVPQEQLVHVFCELLLTHIIDTFVCAHFLT